MRVFESVAPWCSGFVGPSCSGYSGAMVSWLSLLHNFIQQSLNSSSGNKAKRLSSFNLPEKQFIIIITIIDIKYSMVELTMSLFMLEWQIWFPYRIVWVSCVWLWDKILSSIFITFWKKVCLGMIKLVQWRKKCIVPSNFFDSIFKSMPKFMFMKVAKA